jgi:hypothetical protein
VVVQINNLTTSIRQMERRIVACRHSHNLGAGRALTRLCLRPTRRVSVWMDSRFPRRSEAEPVGAWCPACVQRDGMWVLRLRPPVCDEGWGNGPPFGRKNRWIAGDMSGLRSSRQGHALVMRA